MLDLNLAQGLLNAFKEGANAANLSISAELELLPELAILQSGKTFLKIKQQQKLSSGGLRKRVPYELLEVQVLIRKIDRRITILLEGVSVDLAYTKLMGQRPGGIAVQETVCCSCSWGIIRPADLMKHPRRGEFEMRQAARSRYEGRPRYKMTPLWRNGAKLARHVPAFAQEK